jgi:hypothetical protein
MFDTANCDPLEILTRENEIAVTLVERLAEEGQVLPGNEEAAPGRLTEGLRLLGQYRALHGRRFEKAVEPEARNVAMPTCFEHLDQIHRENVALPGRMADVLESLGCFARGEEGARARFTTALASFTQEEYDHLRYEGDYPLSCLQATLPDDARDRILAGFASSTADMADLERHIDQYLSRPAGRPGSVFPVRCAHPGCAAVGEASTFPSTEGHLVFRAPAGWTIGKTKVPPTESDARLRSRLDFRCPEHAGEGVAPGDSSPPTAAARECACLTPAASPAPGVCCGPVSEGSA